MPSAEQKIALDNFHVAPHLGDAIDKVRRREHKRRKAEGDEQLTGTRYLWRKHPDNVSDRDWRGRFQALRESTRQTARAWAMREAAMSLWHDRSRTWATHVWVTQVWATGAWQRGYASAIRSRLEPVKRVARMVKRHLPGIVHAVVLEATHARAESINNRIQRVKCVQCVQRLACGFRNTERFQRAIYFHLAALDMHPPPFINPHGSLKPHQKKLIVVLHTYLRVVSTINIVFVRKDIWSSRTITPPPAAASSSPFTKGPRRAGKAMR